MNVILGHQGWRAVAVGLVVARVAVLKLEDETVAAVDDGSDGLVVRQAADRVVSVAEASGGKCTSVLMFWAVALQMISAALVTLECYAPGQWVWAVAIDMLVAAAVPALAPGHWVWAVAIDVVVAAAIPARGSESGEHTENKSYSFGINATN